MIAARQLLDCLPRQAGRTGDGTLTLLDAPYINDGVGFTADGLIAQTVLRRSVAADRFQRGLGFLYTHRAGTDSSWGANLGWSGAMYRVMTALTLPNAPLTRVSMYGGSGSFDSYYAPAGQTQLGYGTYLVGHQSSDGHWSDIMGYFNGREADDGAGGGEVMMTALDTMILLRNGQAPQPAAIVPPTPPTPPGPPKHLVATPGDGQVSLTWDPPASGSTPFTYAVASTPAGGIITVNGTTATATGLTNGTSYTFTVTVTNQFGQAKATSDPVIPQASVLTCPATGCATPPSAATPELDTVALFAMGLLGLAGYARKRYAARRRVHPGHR